MHTREIDALVALLRRERLAEAELGARKLLAHHPESGILWKILGVALVRQGRDALPELQRATELMPGDAETHQNLGAALHDRGLWAPALASLQRALQLRPDDVGALVDAANALRALGRAREALPLYERAVALDPRHVEAQNNLGNTWLELRQYPEAAASYRRALQSSPEDAQVLCNLGLALVAMRQADEALACYERVLRREPGHVAALNNLGRLLMQLERRREAMLLFARAVEADPGSAESHHNLGSALYGLRRTADAILSFRQALAIRPNFVQAHLSLAEALRQQHEPEAAEASCHAALELEPGNAEALTLEGELRADRGQFAEADALFERAIALDPAYAPAYFSITTHRRMRADDEAWLHGATALLRQPLPFAHQVSLRYALGKYCDDLGQHELAFAHFHEANELTKRHGMPYQAADLERRVANIEQSFSASRVARLAMHGSDSTLPVFVVGMPRSGTSLVEQILASHPVVLGAGEISYWNAAFGAWERLAAEPEQAGKFMAGIERDYLAALPRAPAIVTRVIDKMPANFWFLGLAHAGFPRARIVHVRRDPRDTCLSIYFQNFYNTEPYANDLNHLAHYYGQYRRVMQHWHQVLPPSTLLEVPYEGLVEEPERWTRRMLEFLELPWDPRCLEFHRTERVVITASKWQVRQKISAASIGRWRHYEKFIGPLRQLT